MRAGGIRIPSSKPQEATLPNTESQALRMVSEIMAGSGDKYSKATSATVKADRSQSVNALWAGTSAKEVFDGFPRGIEAVADFIQRLQTNNPVSAGIVLAAITRQAAEAARIEKASRA
jgi:hypothetical protein